MEKDAIFECVVGIGADEKCPEGVVCAEWASQDMTDAILQAEATEPSYLHPGCGAGIVKTEVERDAKCRKVVGHLRERFVAQGMTYFEIDDLCYIEGAEWFIKGHPSDNFSTPKCPPNLPSGTQKCENCSVKCLKMSFYEKFLKNFVSPCRSDTVSDENAAELWSLKLLKGKV